MNYLLLGEDLKSKDSKITAIKSGFFKDAEALNFDLEHLEGHGLSADTLKKALDTLPVLNPKRLIILRDVHKLKTADASVLIQFLNKKADYVDVVLESSETTLKGELKTAAGLCVTSQHAFAPPNNVFDMTKLMSAGKAKEALDMLNDFYTDGVHPLQIMGGLVWFWGKDGRTLNKMKFEQGLHALEQADLNIKRSRLNPEYAVEKVIVELMGLLRGR